LTTFYSVNAAIHASVTLSKQLFKINLQ